MKIKEKSKFYKLHVVRNRIKYGLVLFTLRNLLTRIGLDIDPYYWVQEGMEECEEPRIRGNSEDYRIELINADEVKVMDNILGLSAKELKKNINKGQLCVGLKHNAEIAALMFVGLHSFVLNHRSFELKANEAYLLNMYTFESYRGKNLAPYLRYHSYELLKKQGRNTLYSITAFFNTPSTKFKKKLNAKHLRLYMYLGLFKKYHWNFLLKEYSK